jgi:PBP1b-binding outer membrane lipoprotein LpoB
MPLEDIMSDKVKEAFEVIKQAMIDDNPSEQGGYAYSWHCNIAMMCADAIHADHTEALTSDDAHRIGNDAASRFMKLCFDVETKA